MATKEVETTAPERVIKKHVLVAMGIGAIPIPLVDIAAVTGTQISMISKLASHYEVTFSNDLGKSVLTSLLAAVGGQSMATGTLGSAIKAIPLVGSVLGAVTYPAIAGATTYAVGNVFAKHFAEGGTLLDFRPSRMKEYFSEEFAKGKDVVKNVGRKSKSTTSTDDK